MTATQKLVIEALEEIGVDQKGYYGIVSFHFQDGELALIRREQTLLPHRLATKKEERKNLHARSQSQ